MNDSRTEVRVARIYVTEGKHVHEQIFSRLHDSHRVMGVTVYRGVAGFGRSGATHSSDLLDMSFDLPVVIEFFDTAERVDAALQDLGELLPEGRVLVFDAVNR